jgi:hypothetical protein
MRTQNIYTIPLSSVRETTVTPKRKAELMVTWAMYWYVLTTIILAILHVQSW